MLQVANIVVQDTSTSRGVELLSTVATREEIEEEEAKSGVETERVMVSGCPELRWLCQGRVIAKFPFWRPRWFCPQPSSPLTVSIPLHFQEVRNPESAL